MNQRKFLRILSSNAALLTAVISGCGGGSAGSSDNPANGGSVGGSVASGSGGAGGVGASPGSGGSGSGSAPGSGGEGSGSAPGNGGGGSGGTLGAGGTQTGTGGTEPTVEGPTVDHPSTDTDWDVGLPTGPNGPIPFIVVDQFGYREAARKVAILRDPETGYDADESFTPGSEIAVVDVSSGMPVFSGDPFAWNGGGVDPSSGDRVWWFDFSSVTEPGDYYILDVASGVRSVHFRINNDVYRSVLKHAMRSYYYQRAGQEKLAAHAGADYADGASHLGPGQDSETRSWLDQDNAATAQDLRGGWYDAGDPNKYTAWTAGYVRTLLRAYEHNPSAFLDDYGIPESENGIPDILDEVKWGLDWLVRMQQDDGSLLCIQGLAGASPPSTTDGPSYYGPPTTNATLSVASAFSYASKVYGARPEAEMQSFASDLASRALEAWTWADANPNVTYYNNNDSLQPGSAGLGAGGQEVDDAARLRSKVEAAIYLFEQTGDTSYRDFVDDNVAALVPDWGPQQWHSMEQELLLYYAALPNATAAVADAVRARFATQIMKDDLYGAALNATDPYRAFQADYTWGSNTSKGLVGRLLQMVEQYDIDPALAPEAVLTAEEYTHYIHGVNPLGLVYLTNMQLAGAEHSAKTIFHFWFTEGSPEWDEVTESTPGPAPGILVGGPNPSFSVDGCCTDGSECFGSADFALCANDYEPPANQPTQKSYLQFNDSWPANSWAVTENSNGYQAAYILLLARYAR